MDLVNDLRFKQQGLGIEWHAFKSTLALQLKISGSRLRRDTTKSIINLKTPYLKLSNTGGMLGIVLRNKFE